MSYKLIAPGTRKNNPCWLVRGSINNRAFEISTGTADKVSAKRIAPQLVAKLVESRAAADRPVTTFGQAADRYLAATRPSKNEERRIAKVKAHLGRKLLTEIVSDTLSQAADELLPGRANSTQNREIITPAASVMHYAADNKWVDWVRVKKRTEPESSARPIHPDVAEALIAGAAGDDDLVLLLSLIFFQGRRVGDALKIRGEQIDLSARLFGQRIGKTDKWKWSALHPRVFSLLANRAPLPPGKILRWNHYQSAHFHLKKLCDRLGVRFTFHMARHSFATWLRRAKVDLKAVKELGDWKSLKSVQRYQDVDVEDQRELLALIGEEKPAKTRGG